jgi:hypothetical protein
MTWRRLRPGELDHEALWLGVSLASAGTAWAWLAAGLPQPGCPFRALTGCPCPTCGMTRCVARVLDGEFASAFRLNPLGAAVLAAVAVFDVYAAIVLAARLPRLRGETSTLPLPLRGIAIGALLLNWAWLIRSGV